MKVVTRSQFENELKALGDNPQAHLERCREYGRSLRPHRILTGICVLAVCSEQGTKMTYEKFSEVTGLSSHWERTNILVPITEICVTNKWPCYAALVVREKEQVPGAGLWQTLEELGEFSSKHQDFTDVWETLVSKCYHTPIPPTEVLSAGVTLYLAKAV